MESNWRVGWKISNLTFKVTFMVSRCLRVIWSILVSVCVRCHVESSVWFSPA